MEAGLHIARADQLTFEQPMAGRVVKTRAGDAGTSGEALDPVTEEGPLERYDGDADVSVRVHQKVKLKSVIDRLTGDGSVVITEWIMAEKAPKRVSYPRLLVGLYSSKDPNDEGATERLIEKYNVAETSSRSEFPLSKQPTASQR